MHDPVSTGNSTGDSTGGSTGTELIARGRTTADRRAWADAFEAYSAAADAGSDLEPEDLELWATAAYLLGRVDTAVDALAAAHHRHADTGDISEAVRCGFWLIFVLLGRGDTAQAGGWLARCAHLVEDLPTGAAEHAYVGLVEAFRLVAVERRYSRGRELAADVVAASRTGDDPDLTALALTVVGRASIGAGDATEGMEYLDEAMVSVVSGELTATAAGTVYCSVIEACEEIGALGRAHEWTEALTRWCDRQQGMVTFTGQCLTHRATILHRRGDWEGAAAEAQRARDLFVGAADEAATGRAVYRLAEVYRLSGDHEAAEEAYRDAGEWGHDPQPGLALLRLARGDTEAAAATMRRLIAERDDDIDRIELLPAYVDVMLAVGDDTAAEEGAAELAALAARFGTDALGAMADHAQGSVSVRAGRPEQALVHLRRALEVWRALDAPYEGARTRVSIGHACRAMGDEDGATLEWNAARQVFLDLGAAPDAALVETPAPSAHGDGHPLTEREREVLALVATGMTNRAIADELGLAVKTVDRHVANILTKLGVESRTAATAHAYERDLL